MQPIQKDSARPFTLNMAMFRRDKDEEDEWERLNRQQVYKISAQAYFNRSYNLYPRATEERQVLFYCAFELRCAIERVLFEYLAHIRTNKLSRQEQGLWSAETLKAAILAIEPNFSKKIEFLNLIFKARSISVQFAVPNLARLSKDYGRLNSYLHAMKRPGLIRHAKWWVRFRKLIEELHDYAWSYCAEPRVNMHLNIGAMPLFHEYANGAKTAEDIVAALTSWPEGVEVDVNYRNFVE